MAELNEKQILDKLFKAGDDDSIPKRKVTIERIGLSFLMSGLREGKIEQLERRFTTTTKIRGREETHLDEKRFNRAIVAEATLAIGDNPNVRFNHPELLRKYKASGPEAVVKKVLLAGEIAQLADVVLDLSGYYDTAKEDEEIKNSLPNED